MNYVSRLYTKITSLTVNVPTFPINKKNNNEFELLWHRRLGHFYNKDLNSYLKAHGITKQYFCDACRIVKKLKRCPHNKETPKAKNILEVNPLRYCRTNK